MSTSVPQVVPSTPSCALPNQRRPVLPQLALQETLPCCWRQALASAWRLCSPIHPRNQHDEQRHGRDSLHHQPRGALPNQPFPRWHDLSRTDDLDLWLLQSKLHHSVQARWRQCWLGHLNSKREHQEEDEISYGLIIKVKENHLNKGMVFKIRNKEIRHQLSSLSSACIWMLSLGNIDAVCCNCTIVLDSEWKKIDKETHKNNFC